ncbi:MAG: hypothetical protein JNL11_10900 [Bdellovibrionaceae bacterium]|nr:hypothetical protein [Pseudobdellovibrionaceae bacterium]
MKKSVKTIATVIMASIQSAAFTQPIVVTAEDLAKFENKTHAIGLMQELIRTNVLVQTNKKEVLILNVDAVKKIEDETALKVLSNLIKFVTEGQVEIENKDWKSMTPSTQDYKM